MKELFSALAEKYEEVRNRPAPGKQTGGKKLNPNDIDKKKKGGCCGGK
jgi:hypothetical protein